MGSENQALEVGEARPGRSAVPRVVWLLIALAFTLLQVRQSLHGGRLSAPPTYDDVVYFADAQARLHTFYDHGPAAAVGDLFLDPPHSPWSTSLAALAFVAFGIEDWAPAAANGLLVLGILLWLSRRAGGLAAGWQLAIAAFLLTWPLAGQAVVNFRPDVACGLLVAGTALYIVGRPWIAANPRRHYAAGAGLGLALLIKPTFSPVAAAIVVASLAVATLTDVLRGHPWRRWRRIAGSWTRCLGLGALVAAPYYAVAHRKLYDYVRLHNFGELREVWRPELAAPQQALYYLTGPGGRFLLGVWLYLWIVLAVAALGLALARRDSGALARLPAAAAVFGLTWGLVSIPGHKNEFLGAVLPCLFFLSALETMIYLAAASRSAASAGSRFAAGLVPIALIAGVALFRWPAHSTELGHFLPPREVRQHRQLLDRIHRDILRSGEAPARVLFTQSGPYLNPQLLRYEFGRDRLREVECVDRSMTGDPAELEGELAVATEVIAFSPGNRNAMPWLPSAPIQQQVLDRLREHPRFFLESAYASPGGGQVFLFTKVLGFRGIQPIAGLGPIEGPYPQWGLTFKVRWGLGPASRLEIEVPPSGAVRLILEGNSSLPNQIMTMMVSGRIVGEHRFASRDQFERIELDLERSPGSHVVELEYAQWYEPDEEDDRPRAVLFRTLLALDGSQGESPETHPE